MKEGSKCGGQALEHVSRKQTLKKETEQPVVWSCFGLTVAGINIWTALDKQPWVQNRQGNFLLCACDFHVKSILSAEEGPAFYRTSLSSRSALCVDGWGWTTWSVGPGNPYKETSREQLAPCASPGRGLGRACLYVQRLGKSGQEASGPSWCWGSNVKCHSQSNSWWWHRREKALSLTGKSWHRRSTRLRVWKLTLSLTAAYFFLQVMALPWLSFSQLYERWIHN
jgi:hypothetical protein